MLLNSAADKLVFKFLNKIKNGYLEITTYEGEILKFGNPDQSLKANIKIKNPNFNYNLIRGGSIGFAESYMRGEFETDNLSDLIELTARNIQVIYKFSGLLDLPIINFVKNKNGTCFTWPSLPNKIIYESHNTLNLWKRLLCISTMNK